MTINLSSDELCEKHTRHFIMRLAFKNEEIANTECNPGQSIHWHDDAAQSISAARKSLEPLATSPLLATDLIAVTSSLLNAIAK